VDEVLSTGYLAEAEAAFQRCQIEDYFLVAAGKLRGGSVPLQRATRQELGTTAIRKMFVSVEPIAGVEHVHGRAFYGLRRQATNLAPEAGRGHVEPIPPGRDKRKPRQRKSLSGLHLRRRARRDSNSRPSDP
jgi:hypothetical protein